MTSHLLALPQIKNTSGADRGLAHRVRISALGSDGRHPVTAERPPCKQKRSMTAVAPKIWHGEIQSVFPNARITVMGNVLPADSDVWMAVKHLIVLKKSPVVRIVRYPGRHRTTGAIRLLISPRRENLYDSRRNVPAIAIGHTQTSHYFLIFACYRMTGFRTLAMPVGNVSRGVFIVPAILSVCNFRLPNFTRAR